MGPNLLMLLSAMMLMAGGLALIASGSRMRNELLARRVAMVELHHPLRAAGAQAELFEGYLFRLPVRGLSEAEQREVVRRLSKLGVSADRALITFVLIRLTAAAAVGALVFLWARNVAAFQAHWVTAPAILLMGAIAGWFAPLLFIDYSVRQRTKAVRLGLPDALELMVVCVEAGLSLEDGLGRRLPSLPARKPRWRTSSA